MVKVEYKIMNKTLYKIFLITLKYLPHLIGTLYFIYAILSMYLNVHFMNYIISLSILPLLYILISSFVFKFCTTHRLPIYYILSLNIFNLCLNTTEILVRKETMVVIYTILYIVIYVVPIIYKNIKKKFIV